ncbi:serine hydroxymethyltransferase [Patescibacteria group bacterium]|nr:serine hydroxymethyltransferase [Patescibacteria group bacterium]MBU1472902.1 serine hydroxymethyltransferase [Patescibacteria group bacterium]MBU2459803.1 serine hydroxymethyltransferase [Patescibacteria group bacterium]MBU2544824.1 serine hydroxymethyltransferase [Patescibacteria group bacterium]
MILVSTDPEVAKLIAAESKRQQEVLEMIPSENYASAAVREAIGSVLTNKYSEGYPHKRYYQGNTYIDAIEDIAIDRAKKLFGVPHANVQPYSGSPANAAVYFAILAPGDTIMGLALSAGGHLTHGHPAITFSGKYFHSVQYDVDADGWLNMEEISQLSRKTKPKMIVVGTTAYPRIFDWKHWKVIADEAGALLLADISHIAGLVVGGVHPSPVQYADIVMTTTHKTLRGPRGALLMVTESGLKKDPKMAEKIDKAVFPGIQGGPHDNVTAAIAIALKEADSQSFRAYAKQIVANAKVLAKSLTDQGLKLTTGGTDNHLMVIDLRPQGLSGNVVAEALEVAGIVVNKNSVPHDPNPPFYPSGIRLGTPAVTTRGMKEPEMQQIGQWISQVINIVKDNHLPGDKETRNAFFVDFRKKIIKNKELLTIAANVQALCRHFPVP